MINHITEVSKCCIFFFFFFKQKTAYEIYQCDWSSDVCSSDLSEILTKDDLDVLNPLKDELKETFIKSQVFRTRTDRKSVV